MAVPNRRMEPLGTVLDSTVRCRWHWTLRSSTMPKDKGRRGTCPVRTSTGLRRSLWLRLALGSGAVGEVVAFRPAARLMRQALGGTRKRGGD